MDDSMTDAQIRIADLPAGKPHSFLLQPDREDLTRLAERLGIPAVRKIRFEGQLQPLGQKDWQLKARLGATVVQPCIVTLDPVTTRLEEDVSRTYRADLPEETLTGELEMPEDDSEEPLPRLLDLGEVMLEALALALPLYPRADGVGYGDTQVAEPGTAPLTDEEVKPFAGLKTLRDKLEKDQG
jgi:uncharacterized metal-binding protein YceD (DUF177 family)